MDGGGGPGVKKVKEAATGEGARTVKEAAVGDRGFQIQWSPTTWRPDLAPTTSRRPPATTTGPHGRRSGRRSSGTKKIRRRSPTSDRGGRGGAVARGWPMTGGEASVALAAGRRGEASAEVEV
ncbi:Os06g0329700 [Oryza sativa Japonica Group]|uniref:Os06g0329700 protein n=1 Tax=Oryza sativa subsp. japonica TaxID=39947 RepID=A0A0N7KM15_ORYSJ|nr:Os06g0329700 [Oryza sativa Japonica Group]